MAPSADMLSCPWPTGTAFPMWKRLSPVLLVLTRTQVRVKFRYKSYKYVYPSNTPPTSPTLSSLWKVLARHTTCLFKSSESDVVGFSLQKPLCVPAWSHREPHAESVRDNEELWEDVDIGKRVKRGWNLGEDKFKRSVKTTDDMRGPQSRSIGSETSPAPLLQVGLGPN